MDKITCKICNNTFDDDITFHRHLRTHKVTQASYYQSHYPHLDRYDGSLIKFKNKEYYFSTDFNSRGNLKKWLNEVSPEEARTYIACYLTQRRLQKGMEFAPTQIELRTLPLPGMIYIIDKIAPYNNYNLFCGELGFKTRFTSTMLNPKWFKNISNKVIFADKREQKPLSFDNQTRSKSMPFGDYRMANCDIYIERKSLNDAWGTLTGGLERFEREILRAKEAGAYLIILVEDTLENLSKFPYQRQVYGKIKLPIEFVHHNMRVLLQKYTHIQFLFCKDRKEASRLVEKIFSAGEQIKNVDLQYLLDKGEL